MRTVALVDGSVQPGGRAPAPDPLSLVQAFVNTVDREHGPDLLDGGHDAPLAAWCAHRGLGAVADREEALAVREALRALLWANNPEPAPEAAEGAVDAAVAVLDRAAARLTPRLDPPRFEARDAVAEVVGVAFLAMADGSWSRLKACPGPHCGWAFYDRSVNVSAAWCSMRVCGNRAKAKAYYRRRR